MNPFQGAAFPAAPAANPFQTQPTAANPFQTQPAANPFQTAAPAPGANPFQTQPAAANPFQTQTAANPFQTAAPAAANPFQTTSPFGQPNAFSTPTLQYGANAFGQQPMQPVAPVDAIRWDFKFDQLPPDSLMRKKISHFQHHISSCESVARELEAALRKRKEDMLHAEPQKNTELLSQHLIEQVASIKRSLTHDRMEVEILKKETMKEKENLENARSLGFKIFRAEAEDVTATMDPYFKELENLLEVKLREVASQCREVGTVVRASLHPPRLDDKSVLEQVATMNQQYFQATACKVSELNQRAKKQKDFFLALQNKTRTSESNPFDHVKIKCILHPPSWEIFSPIRFTKDLASKLNLPPGKINVVKVSPLDMSVTVTIQASHTAAGSEQAARELSNLVKTGDDELKASPFWIFSVQVGSSRPVQHPKAGAIVDPTKDKTQQQTAQPNAQPAQAAPTPAVAPAGQPAINPFGQIPALPTAGVFGAAPTAAFPAAAGGFAAFGAPAFNPAATAKKTTKKK